MGEMMRKILFIFYIFLIMVSCQGLKEEKREKINVIAVVGRINIRKEDLLSQAKEYLEDNGSDNLLSSFLDNLIEEALILNEFIKDDEKKLEFNFSDFGDSDKRKEIVNLIMEKNVYSQIEVSEKEIEDYYNRNRDKFLKKEGYLLRQMILSGKNIKDEAYRMLKRGFDFEEIARLYSISPEKGRVQYFDKNEIPEYILDMLSLLKEGEISEPLEVSDGTFQIVKLEKRVKNYLLPLEMVKQLIRLNLYDMKSEKVKKDFYNSLKKKYKVVIIKENLWFSYKGAIG